MSDENQVFSQRYLTVAEANRRNYANVAESYVKHVRCVKDKDDQSLLQGQLQRLMDELGDMGRPPVVVDACGGAGNAAMMLNKLGCHVHLVDISPQMIAIYERTCKQEGFKPTTHCDEIGSFFTKTDLRYDLIVFSSAIHHLEDPVLVLSLAEKSLESAGMIATIFDPIRLPKPLRILAIPFKWLHRAASNPKLVFTRVGPVIRNIVRGGQSYKERTNVELNDDNIGLIAEWHGGRGFDDFQLAGEIQEKTNLEVVCHERLVRDCSAFEKMLYKLLRIKNSFVFLLRSKTAT